MKSNEDQLAHVIQLGCEQAQGFLFAKPMDALAAARFIKATFSCQSTDLRCYLCPTNASISTATACNACTTLFSPA